MSGQPEFRRLDGDTRPAMGFAAAQDLIARALSELRAPTVAPTDRCIAATETLTRIELVLTRAFCDLEVVTSVPWTAIMYPFSAQAQK